MNRIKYLCKVVKYYICNILLLFSGLLNIELYKQVGYFIDILNTTKDWKDIKKIVSSFFMYFIMAFIFKIIGKIGTIKHSWDIVNDTKLKIIDYAVYEKMSQPTGKVLDMLDRDIQNIKNFYQNTTPSMVYHVAVIIGMFVSSFHLHYRIAFMLLLWFLLAFCVTLFYEKKQKKDSNIIENKRIAEGELSTSFLETLRLKDLIFALKKQDYFMKRTEQNLNTLKDNEIKEQKFLYVMWIISLFFIKFGLLIVLFIGGIFVFKNQISLGELYTLFLYTNSLATPLETLQTLYRSLIVFKNSKIRIDEFLSNKHTEKVFNLPPQSIDEINVSDLSVMFDDHVIFSNVNLNMSKGVHLMYGKSGIGKSSLLKTIAKIYPIYIGNIEFLYRNKVIDVREEDILYVENEGFLFVSSFEEEIAIITNNVAYLENIPKNTLFQKIVDLQTKDDFDESDKRIINILRALMSDTNIIIFDETFAGIEKEMIQNILSFIEENFNHKITIIVSHNIELKMMIERQFNLEELVTT